MAQCEGAALQAARATGVAIPPTLTRAPAIALQADNIVPKLFCPYVSCSMPTIYFSDLLKIRLSSLVGLASGTSKTCPSLLLGLSSSRINKPSEYIILNSPFCDHRVFVRMLPELLNCQRDQDQMQDFAVVGKNCRLENSSPAGYLKLSLPIVG